MNRPTREALLGFPAVTDVLRHLARRIDGVSDLQPTQSDHGDDGHDEAAGVSLTEGTRISQ